MRKPLTFLFALLAGNLAAGEIQGTSKESFREPDLRLRSVECPKQCSAWLLEILESQIGQPIYFSGNISWTSGTAEPCDHILSIHDKVFLVDEFLQEINLGQPPKQPMTNKELGLTNAQFLVMDVTCASAVGIKSTHRFIQRNSSQLIVIDEEASILVYE